MGVVFQPQARQLDPTRGYHHGHGHFATVHTVVVNSKIKKVIVMVMMASVFTCFWRLALDSRLRVSCRADLLLTSFCSSRLRSPRSFLFSLINWSNTRDPTEILSNIERNKIRTENVSKLKANRHCSWPASVSAGSVPLAASCSRWSTDQQLGSNWIFFYK